MPAECDNLYIHTVSIILKEENIAALIYFIRGEKVMFDSDLAKLYGVTTTRLNEQVKRNLKRFPADFMFQLKQEEYQNLISQNATSSWGGRRKLPFVFAEHGVVMLASKLNSDVAITASIQVVRTFVKLREILGTHKELAYKLQVLEGKYDKHDKEIQVLFQAIRQLIQTLQERKSVLKSERSNSCVVRYVT